MTAKPKMENNVIVVTGATSGIGYYTALELARMGAEVVVVGRNQEKCTTSVDRITAETGNQKVSFFVADLSSLKEIRSLANQIKDKFDRLDVLVNNAGAFFTRRCVSPDGYEMTLALNHLNYFYLTNLLLDLIDQSKAGRIVNVSSMAHSYGKINFDDLQCKNEFNSMSVYSSSKLANVLFTYELVRRLPETKITVNALHPGFVATNFGKSNGGIYHPIFGLAQLAAISPQKGAETSIYLASSPEVEGVTGKYFDRKKAVRSSDLSNNTKLAAQLWLVSEQLTSVQKRKMDGVFSEQK